MNRLIVTAAVVLVTSALGTMAFAQTDIPHPPTGSTYGNAPINSPGPSIGAPPALSPPPTAGVPSGLAPDIKPDGLRERAEAEARRIRCRPNAACETDGMLRDIAK